MYIFLIMRVKYRKIVTHLNEIKCNCRCMYCVLEVRTLTCLTVLSGEEVTRMGSPGRHWSPVTGPWWASLICPVSFLSLRSQMATCPAESSGPLPDDPDTKMSVRSVLKERAVTGPHSDWRNRTNSSSNLRLWTTMVPEARPTATASKTEGHGAKHVTALSSQPVKEWQYFENANPQ